MTVKPSLDDVFAVMSAASFGDPSARVRLPDDPQIDDVPTKLAMALNVLLDDLSARASASARMAARLRILTDAAREFSAKTHDIDTLLDTVARRLVAVVGDHCNVQLLSEDGLELVPAAIHAADEENARRTREVFSGPFVIEKHPMSRRVHQTGEPILVPKLDTEDLSGLPRAFADLTRHLGVHSVLVAPLRVHGRPLGQLVLMRYRPESPPFDNDDLSLLSALADHGALAIANARSYAAERAARLDAEKAEQEQRASEARYRLMFDKSPLPKWLYDSETLRLLAVNDAAVLQYGYSREEFLTMTIKDIRPPEEVPALLEALRTAPISGVWRHRKKSGEVIFVDVTTHTFLLAGQMCRLAVGKNVTDQLRLEEQLRQSQKMDAIGRLAGGVAHDFNNILSVILTYSQMILADLRPGDPLRDDIGEIYRAGTRAAELTRQLLMFSRQQVMAPKVLDLNELLTGMDKMLQRILGADIDLVSLPTVPLGRVRADPSSVEQVIMNLVVNARDAMPTGGKLTMETSNVVLDEAYAKAHSGVKPGPHVMLAVTDTGTGIDKEIQARIFEPFFTTKEKGKGTGLGLSTVFGIAQQSGGSVWLYSEVGRGTTFKVYLPRVDADADESERAEGPTTLTGSETILLVEDDDQVRTVARGILRKSGYRVIDARNGGEALLHSENHPGQIHLLLSDVVMPQMSGPELAKRLLRARPDMKVLCMSGYTDDSIVRHGVLEAKICFLQKPITPRTLATRVREVLDGAPNA